MRKRISSYLAFGAGLIGLLAARSGKAAVIFTEDFEGGLSAWAANNGLSGASPATTSSAPAPEGLSFVHKDGQLTRIVRGFTLDSAATSVRFSAEFYTNSTISTQKSYATFGQATNGTPTTNGAMIGAGANNLGTYQYVVFTSSLQNHNTGVALSVGWHSMSVTYDLTSTEGSWVLDGASGSYLSGRGLTPNAIIIGQSSVNGSSGGADTSVWWDNVKVEQFAPAASKAAADAPSAGETDIPLDQDLAWSGGGNIFSYNLFFGTEPTPGLLAAGLTGTAMSLESLQPDTTYYWRVDSANAVGDVTTGDTWSFRTAAAPEPAGLTGIMAGLGLLLRRRRK